MQLIRAKEYNLSEIKRIVEGELQKECHYRSLEKRREKIIEYLNSSRNTKENKIFLAEYEKLGKKIKNMEIQTAFAATIQQRKNNRGIKRIINIIMRKNDENKIYQDEFNKILENDSYKKKIKKHNEMFKELLKKFRKSKEMLYELESVETEIATILTDGIREYTQKNVKIGIL